MLSEVRAHIRNRILQQNKSKYKSHTAFEGFASKLLIYLPEIERILGISALK